MGTVQAIFRTVTHLKYVAAAPSPARVESVYYYPLQTGPNPAQGRDFGPRYGRMPARYSLGRACPLRDKVPDAYRQVGPCSCRGSDIVAFLFDH